MAVTIKDVAKETNLAISTISKYMNGKTVREENRQLIEAAVKKLGYHPNNAARGLRSACSYMIGLVLDGLDNQYFSLLAAGITEMFKAEGYTVLVCFHRNDGVRAKKAVDFLIGRQVDGIVALSIATNIDYLGSAWENHIPVVVLDRMMDIPCDMVGSNAASGSYQAVEFLIQQGHKKIAVISGTNKENPGIKAAWERLTGYERVLKDYAMEYRDEYVACGDFTLASGYTCMQNLWKLKDRPTAVFVTNYNMTLGAVTAMHNLKINIPKELSVVAFDDMEFSTLCKPNLTAVRQPVKRIAKASVNMLLKRVRGDYGSFPEYVKFPTELHVRGSVEKI